MLEAVQRRAAQGRASEAGQRSAEHHRCRSAEQFTGRPIAAAASGFSPTARRRRPQGVEYAGAVTRKGSARASQVNTERPSTFGSWAMAGVAEGEPNTASSRNCPRAGMTRLMAMPDTTWSLRQRTHGRSVHEPHQRAGGHACQHAERGRHHECRDSHREGPGAHGSLDAYVHDARALRECRAPSAANAAGARHRAPTLRGMTATQASVGLPLGRAKTRARPRSQASRPAINSSASP